MGRRAGMVGLLAGMVVSASLALADGVVQFTPVPGERDFSGELIARPVQLDAWAALGADGATANQRYADAAAAVAGFADLRYVWQTDEYIFDVPPGQTENTLANQLMATGLFQYVEPNWIVYPIACPNDPSLGSQWHHNANRMQSCDGWGIHSGNPSASVGICDTGVDTGHPDLQLHRLEGYNAVNRIWENVGGQIGDINGHGTNTTGCAAANGNNGIGVSGVGWNLSHRMLRVSNDSGGSSSLEVLNHAARTAIENGNKVASVSYSGCDNATNLSSATYIKSIGGLLVWAAGNDNRNLTFGNRDNDDMIVAGGTDSNDAKASFSAFGQFVDVVAPAVGVFTTARSNSYAAVSGTSFACPLTAGLCALIFSANPSLTPDEVEGILKAGCEDLGTPGIDDTFAYGRINVFLSLSRITRPPQFNFPNGLPARLDPAGGDVVRVVITAGDIAPVPGTGRLHVNDGGGWLDLPMQQITPNVYDAVFPSTACGHNVRFYFSTQGNDNNTYNNPSGAPTVTYSALSAESTEQTIFTDNFQQNLGWTTEILGATSGQWQRGVPVNDPAWDFDPVADSDGSGSCWLTQNELGNTDVDNGSVRLTSPVIDMTLGGIIISYDYYLNLTVADGVDRLLVEINNNNGVGPWITLVAHTTSGNLAWRHHQITQGDLDALGVVLTATMKVRFTANDTGTQSINESGLDAVKVTSVCGGSCDPCDMNCDGGVDAFDIENFIDVLFNGEQPCSPCAGDVDGNGQRNAFDVQPFIDCLFGP